MSCQAAEVEIEGANASCVVWFRLEIEGPLQDGFYLTPASK